MRVLCIVILLLSLASCRVGVKQASVATQPPKVEKSSFSTTQIEGTFVASTSLMFLWPQDRWDEGSQSYIPLTFAEKVESRKDVVLYSDQKDLYEGQYQKAQLQLDTKWNALSETLVKDYKDLKCYSYCDPEEDFFCDPEDSTVLFQDTWVCSSDVTEVVLNEEQSAEEVEEPADSCTPELKEVIKTCQANEEERRTLEAAQAVEEAELVLPLKQKAGEAALALLNAIGNRNFFDSLSSFKMIYALPETCSQKGFCVGEEGLLIELKMGDIVLSNKAESDSEFGVSDVELDPINGFLTFKIPAIDFENNQTVYGEILFDLEVNSINQGLRIDGDIRVNNYETGQEAIGRFSSSGAIEPF